MSDEITGNGSVRYPGSEVDIIITTALIPGKTAPVLITQEMVEAQAGVSHRRYGCRAGGKRRYQTLVRSTLPGDDCGLTDLPSRMACQEPALWYQSLPSPTTWVGLTTKVDLDEVVLRCPGNPRREVTWPHRSLVCHRSSPSLTQQQPAMAQTNQVEASKPSQGR